jgi:GAF domain-containing protein
MEGAPDELPPPATGVPVEAEGRPIGVLGVCGDPGAPLSDADRELLKAISRQASEALQRARLLEEAEQRARREQLIRATSDAMQRATDLESLIEAAAEGLVEALGACSVYVRMGVFGEPGEE